MNDLNDASCVADLASLKIVVLCTVNLVRDCIHLEYRYKTLKVLKVYNKIIHIQTHIARLKQMMISRNWAFTLLLCTAHAAAGQWKPAHRGISRILLGCITVDNETAFFAGGGGELLTGRSTPETNFWASTYIFFLRSKGGWNVYTGCQLICCNLAFIKDLAYS